MAKAKATRKQSTKKEGKLDAPFTTDVIPVHQHDKTLYQFAAPASVLFEMLSINRRNPDVTKEEGYQRVLPISRVRSIATHISEGNTIPTSLLVSFDKAEVKGGKLIVPPGTDVGWVIDGQHRLAGAYEAGLENPKHDIEFSVVCAIGLTVDEQVRLFVTINREAKTVPTSLVLDLIKKIPNRRPSDVANERAADIAKFLNLSETSPFYNRIVIDAPRANQMSLTNFVRKVTPLVLAQKGRLKDFSYEDQLKILDNYFLAFSDVYESEWKSSNSIFFKTLGFGAIMNVFEKVFNEVSQREGAFTKKKISKYLNYVADFDFNQWSSYGSGNKAETEAAKDFEIDFARRLLDQQSSGKLSSLKLDD